MENNIDTIVDVDPKEAQLLTELIEALFKEWYVARHEREERFAKIAAVAEQIRKLNKRWGVGSRSPEAN